MVREFKNKVVLYKVHNPEVVLYKVHFSEKNQKPQRMKNDLGGSCYFFLVKNV